MKTQPWGAFLLLLLTVDAYAQLPGFVEVPPEQTPGGTLVAEPLRMAITAPPGWRWYFLSKQDASKATSYTCEHTRSGRRFTINVVKTDPGEVTPKKLEEGFVQAAKSAGWDVEKSSSSVSDVPMPGAIRVTWRGSLRGGQPLSMRVYMIQARRTYTITYQGPEETEPVDFEQFVRSFHLLPDQSAAKWKGFQQYAYYYLLLGGAVAGFVVNAIAKRRVVNPGTVAAALIGVYLVLKLLEVTQTRAIVGLPSTGRSPSEILLEPLWPALIALLIHFGSKQETPATD